MRWMEVRDEVAEFGPRFQATMPDAYTWESQVWQYQDAQPPAEEGITYFAGPLPSGHIVDCLLYWKPTTSGRMRIVGILNHYGFDSPLERKGNVNIWVRRPNQHQGIGTALWDEAVRRWNPSLDQQRFTAEGVRLAEYLVTRPAPEEDSPPKG